jgi:hypothetical protein
MAEARLRRDPAAEGRHELSALIAYRARIHVTRPGEPSLNQYFVLRGVMF